MPHSQDPSSFPIDCKMASALTACVMEECVGSDDLSFRIMECLHAAPAGAEAHHGRWEGPRLNNGDFDQVPTGLSPLDFNAGSFTGDIIPLTTSLNAALGMVNTLIPECAITLKRGLGPSARWAVSLNCKDGRFINVKHSNPILAICAGLLRMLSEFHPS